MTPARRDSLTASTFRLMVPMFLATYGLVLGTSGVGLLGDTFWVGGPPGSAPGPEDIMSMVALVAAGAVTWFGGGSWQTAGLAIVTGLAWLAPHIPLDPGAPGVIRLTAIGLMPVLTLHLVLATASDGPVRGRRQRILLGLYLFALVLAVLRSVTYDPFFEPECACGHVPAMIEPPPGVRLALHDTERLSAIVAGALLALWSTRDLASVGRSTRRRWTMASGAVIAVATISVNGLELTSALGSPGGPVSLASVEAALAWLRAGGLLYIAAALAYARVWRLRTRSRLRRLADDIQAAPPPGSLEDALAAALGGADVTVGYWLAESARHVDADGAPFAPGDHTDDRRTTTIERGGVPVAVVRHRADLDPAVLGDIGSSLRIALDNERLRAASLAHLRDLQTSRARIVEVGDAERRRVERDLHDGAQQGLLAVAFDLRLARLNAERGGDPAHAERLANAESLAVLAVEELRRIARGVHPAILSQAGLAAALESLRDGAPIPVEVRSETRDRLPPPVEAAAYRVAVDALADAVRRGARELGLRVDGDASRLVIDATDDGAITDSPAVRISDRVGASGGSVVVRRRPDGHGNILSAVIPCA